MVMGITTCMVEILSDPYGLSLSLSPVGTNLAKGDAFGTIEGDNLTTDLISPVSGKCIQINDFLVLQSILGAILDPIIFDPYNSGWLVVVQLNNPTELNSLLTPQAYVNLLVASEA